MKKKAVSVLLAMSMATAMLVGCGADSNTEGNEDQNTEKTESNQEGEEKENSGDELVYWSMWEEAEAQGQVIAEAVEKFNETSDIKITVEFKGRTGMRDGLEPALQAGQQIDLFDEADNTVNIVWGKYCYDLTDLVKESNYEETANPALMERFREQGEGKLLSIPYQPYVHAFFYNKTIFEEAGITSVPKTWDEFLTVCEKIKAAGYTPLTTDDAYATWAFGAHLGRLIGDEAVEEMVKNEDWDNPALLQAAKDYEELASKGYFSEMVESNVFPAGQNSEFALGEVAMYFDGSWVPNETKDIVSEDFEWGAFAYPEVEGGVNGTETVTIASQAMAINKDCKHPEEAFKFIQLLTQGEMDAKLAQDSMGIPASTETQEWPEQLASVKEIMDNATDSIESAGGIETNLDVTPVLKENLLKLYGGSITAEEFVENLKK